MRRAARVLLIAVVVGGILFLFVLPVRTWLQQSRAMSAAQHRIQLLSEENRALTTRTSELQSTAYVERIAREDYGLVMPGEQAYGILLPPVPPTTVAPLPAKHPHG
jgi:cell division protein FtsB